MLMHSLKQKYALGEYSHSSTNTVGGFSYGNRADMPFFRKPENEGKEDLLECVLIRNKSGKGVVKYVCT